MKNKYKCPECGRKLKFFDEIIDLGQNVQEWRCKNCQKELYLVLDDNKKVNKDLSFWTDFYGKDKNFLFK